MFPQTIDAIPVPLRLDERGAVRVGKSRVVLDVVIREYKDGADPESIARAYPSLNVADIYAVIAHYLRNRDQVDQYLEARRVEAERLRTEIEATQPDRASLKEKLLARRAEREQAHASPRG